MKNFFIKIKIFFNKIRKFFIRKKTKNCDEESIVTRLRRRRIVKSLLTVIVIAVGLRNFFLGDFESVFLCALTLILFSIPALIDRKLHIDIPPTLEIVILFFIFSAEILGELSSFYTIFPFWDTMLHVINGFLAAAVGFSLIDIINRSDKFSVMLSPFFLVMTAFCFSMTIGVIWEFFEFFMDYITKSDMQKDHIITQINSVIFDPLGRNSAVRIPIKSLIVNGEDWIKLYGGYIDIGLVDTMVDLFVNFLGASVFSIIAYLSVTGRNRGKFAKRFIPTIKDDT